MNARALAMRLRAHCAKELQERGYKVSPVASWGDGNWGFSVDDFGLVDAVGSAGVFVSRGNVVNVQFARAMSPMKHAINTCLANALAEAL